MPAPLPCFSRLVVLAGTALVMAAFAANSVLARLALLATDVDAATFTAVRRGAWALMLWGVARLRRGGVAFVAEPITPRLVAASVATLGGIALVLRARPVSPRR